MATARFVMPKKYVTLIFEDGDYAGANVKCYRRAPLDLVLRLQRLLNSDDDADQKEAIRYLGDEILVEWNLEEEELDENGNEIMGEGGIPLTTPIPATGEALLAQPGDFGITLLTEWLKSLSSITTNLKKE